MQKPWSAQILGHRYAVILAACGLGDDIFAGKEHVRKILAAEGEKIIVGRQRRPKTKKLRLPDQPLQRAHQHGGQGEQDKIDRYARDGHQKIIPAAMTQVVGIDRHGLCPAHARQKHHQRADQAEVPQGIERQPPRIARGRIAAAIRHIPVRDFMQNKRQQHSRGAIQHKLKKSNGI